MTPYNRFISLIFILLVIFHAVALAFISEPFIISINCISLTVSYILFQSSIRSWWYNVLSNFDKILLVLTDYVTFISTILCVYVIASHSYKNDFECAVVDVSLAINIAQWFVATYILRSINELNVPNINNVQAINRITIVHDQMKEDCTICSDKNSPHYVTNCQHYFCKICLDKWLETHNTCPICRTKIREQ